MGRRTTIQVSVELKELLNKLKIHPRETYEDVIRRLVDTYRRVKDLRYAGCVAPRSDGTSLIGLTGVGDSPRSGA